MLCGTGKAITELGTVIAWTELREKTGCVADSIFSAVESAGKADTELE